MDLSNLVDDQFIPQSVGGKETMLVTNEFRAIFSSNGFIFLISANKQVQDLIQSRLNKMTLLELGYQFAEKRRFWDCIGK